LSSAAAKMVTFVDRSGLPADLPPSWNARGYPVARSAGIRYRCADRLGNPLPNQQLAETWQHELASVQQLFGIVKHPSASGVVPVPAVAFQSGLSGDGLDGVRPGPARRLGVDRGANRRHSNRCACLRSRAGQTGTRGTRRSLCRSADTDPAEGWGGRGVSRLMAMPPVNKIRC
jgi:hypothetical protein